MAKNLYKHQYDFENILEGDLDSEALSESFPEDEDVDYLESQEPAEDGDTKEEVPCRAGSRGRSRSGEVSKKRNTFQEVFENAIKGDVESASENCLTDEDVNYQEPWEPAEDGETNKGHSGSPPGPRPEPSQTRWNSEQDPDNYNCPKKFTPKRKPGHQLPTGGKHTPLDLFSHFMDITAITNLCRNINKQAAKNIANGKKYTWTRLREKELYKFIGLTFYFGLVKLSAVGDYWKQNSIFSQTFPPKVMTRDRFRTISWNVHISDPDQDADNDEKKGTPQFDKLFRLRPLLDTLKTACKSNYHPRQNISIDERMVATKAHTGMTQYMKAKPMKWGFELFVLADSSNGYTVDFSVYTGKSPFSSGLGLGHDAVMSLVKPSFLGGGYHLYVDNFYTSPKLFRDLYDMNVYACGAYRKNRKACPSAQSNALRKNDPRGTIRWIREGPLVFVKWMDSREVAICSTVHKAFTGETVKRRAKDEDGQWVTRDVPCPNPVIEYNKHMGGVDLSDQLIQYYTVHHTTKRWYRTLFYLFLDIAATNAYILHKELCQEKADTPMTHRSFLENLTAQLCDVTVTMPPAKAPEHHLPVAISEQEDTSKRASYGRRSCVHCRNVHLKKQSTPWKCQACDAALCLIADRNCFQLWHQQK